MAAVAGGVRPLPAHGLPALRPVQPGPSPGPAAPRPDTPGRRYPADPLTPRTASAAARPLPGRTRPPSASARPPRTSNRGSSSLIWVRIAPEGALQGVHAEAVRTLHAPAYVGCLHRQALDLDMSGAHRVEGQEQHLSAGAGAYPAQRQGAEAGHRDVVEDGRLLGPTACDTRRSHHARPGTRESRVIVDRGGGDKCPGIADQSSRRRGQAPPHINGHSQAFAQRTCPGELSRATACVFSMTDRPQG